MGLLDDAIREHLDLKRRRGADPMEVERAEREALGPVRRAPDTASNGETDEEPNGFAYDREREEGSWSHEAAADEPGSEPFDIGSESDFGSEHDDERLLDEDEDFEPEDHGRSADPDRLPPPHRADDEETVEYDVEEALGSEHHPGAGTAEPIGDEDVLEETPEFLQDTPDHDRLWFEQRPPKDFDFDG